MAAVGYVPGLARNHVAPWSRDRNSPPQALASCAATALDHSRATAARTAMTPDFTVSLWRPDGVAREQAAHEPDVIDEKQPEAQAQQTGRHPKVALDVRQSPGGVRHRRRDDQGD